MSKFKAFAMLNIAFHVAAAGCTSEQYLGNILGVSLPTRIPSEIEMVRANSHIYDGSINPLSEVAAGSVINELFDLSGCWGNYRIADTLSETGDLVQTEVLEVLQFEPDAGTLRNYVLSVASGDLGFGTGGNEILSEHVCQFRIVNDNTIEIEIIDSLGGLVTDSEGIVFNFAASFVGPVVSIGNSYTTLITLSGEYLKTDSGEINAPTGETRNVQLWTQLDCGS